MWVLMIRPQQKRQKQWQQMLGSIKAGDKVTTAGGIRGTIISIKDDVIIVKVAPDESGRLSFVDGRVTDGVARSADSLRMVTRGLGVDMTSLLRCSTRAA